MLHNLIKKRNHFFIYHPKDTQPNNLDTVLLISLLTSILFVPFIPVSPSFFFSLEELFVVLIGIRLLQKWFLWLDWYFVIVLLFAAYVVFVILINPNRANVSEYFEVYKILKYGVIYVFSIYYFFSAANKKTMRQFIYISFALLVIFNFLHYFNVFNFNKSITILYDSDGRDVLSFGLNSIGLPGPKRMVGTMGNPNDNAILFLFYFAYFQFQTIKIKSGKFNAYKLCYYVTFLMIVMCQSRTGILATFFVFLAGFLLREKKKEKLVFYLFDLIIFAALIYLLFYFEKVGGIGYLGNTDIMDVDQNSSVRGRLEIWAQLIEMWSHKPLFGYGPNKEFMYSNFVYPENEYIFYLWRYGIIGLIFYLLIVFVPAIKLIKFKCVNRFIIYNTLLISIIALTNNPYSNPKFLIIIALIIGYCVSLYYQKRIKADE